MYDILQLNDMLVPELKELAEKIGLSNFKRVNKQELIYKILDHQALSESDDDDDNQPDEDDGMFAFEKLLLSLLCLLIHCCRIITMPTY